MTEVAAIEQVTHSLIRAEPCCGCDLSSGLLASRPTLQTSRGSYRYGWHGALPRH
jgi:hypothetical protein